MDKCFDSFFVAACSYFLVTEGKIVINVYRDELRFLQYAVSIVERNGVSLHGMTTNYIHILYSICIAPVLLLVQDSILQIKCITLLNCFLMASVCFPIALISKKTIQSPYVALIPVLLSLLIPETLYSTTLMSENLFYPLSVWTVYFLQRSFRDKRIGNNIIAGIFCGLLVLTKAIGVAFPISYVFLLFAAFLRNSNRTLKPAVLTIFVFLFSFAVVYGGVCLPILLSAQIADGYSSQIGIALNLALQGSLSFFFYGLLHNLIFVIIGFLVIPVIIPIVFRDYLNNNGRFLMQLSLTVATLILINRFRHGNIP